MMRVYALTPWGRRLARSTRNPNTAGFRAVHYLDRVGSATQDQLADNTGVNSTELMRMRNARPPIVAEVS